MPRRSSPVATEKSPVERVDLEGLQLDTRAREIRDPYLDDSKPQGFLDDDFDDHINYINEKQTRSGWPAPLRSPRSNTNSSRRGPMGGAVPRDFEGPSRKQSLPPDPVQGRVCGLKRRHFWVVFGLALSFIITASVVGGVVGGLQAQNNPESNPWSSSGNFNGSTLPPYLMGDVLANSPINVVSYDLGKGDPDDRQVFRVYYQSISGNITEAISSGLSTWQTARPIFTDAMNYTGLASVTYLNGTQQQGSIFYVGSNGLLQEKRKLLNTEDWWEPGTLNGLNLPMVGNITLPPGSTDPPNLVDSWRMAAVYSKGFKSGAGIRLFYHAEDLNGTTYIQELIWNQSQDKWSKGAEITGAYPNSHLAVAVDESTSILRLFFSSGNETLQEIWGDTSANPMKYTAGIVRIPNILIHNAADLAATSYNGTTSLFYYATTSQSLTVGIHELTISGSPNDGPGKNETFNLNAPLVYNPPLSIGRTTFPYVPLACALTVVPNLSSGNTQILAFWAESVTGDPTKISGYRQLSEASKAVTAPAWPAAAAMKVPLAQSP